MSGIELEVVVVIGLLRRIQETLGTLPPNLAVPKCSHRAVPGSYRVGGWQN